MTDPRSSDDVPLNPPGPDRLSHLTQLEGREPREEQDAVVSEDQVESRGAPSDTEIYEGDLEALGGLAGPASGPADALASLDLRPGETSDAGVAAEEGETWVPPVDPPVVADREAPGGVVMAAGFGSTAQDEPYDMDHHDRPVPTDDEMADRVREAIAADARTSRLADEVEVEVEGTVVTLRGDVPGVDDGDLLGAVALGVTGIAEVRDETAVGGL